MLKLIMIIALLVGIDQISKIMALKYLTTVSTIPIIENVFHLTYVENRGAAFGMFENNQIVFIVVAVLASIYGIYYLCNNKVHNIGRCAIILIISGAIGNLIDRVRLGFVVDYFDFRFIWEYVFNIADIFVVFGTIIMCVYIIYFEEKDKLENTKG
ncbi:MAG: signal peptidase II [Peptostreptococcaceae bacterium]